MSFLQLRSPYERNSSVPLVTTQAPDTILSTSANGNGTVVTARSSITERGFVYNTTGNPTTSDTKVTVAGTTGAYSTALTGLTPSTTYYYRAYAINAFGTGYGDVWLIVTTASATTGIFSHMLMGMGM